MNYLPQQLEKVVLTLCEDTDTPRALTVSLLVRNREWLQLVQLRCDPLHYSSSLAYLLDAAVTDLLRKADFLKTGIDLKAKAVQTFFESEQQCCKTNARLSPFLMNGPFEGPNDGRLVDFFDLTKKLVKFVLGPLPKTLQGRFGPGATFEDKGRKATLLHKLKARPASTLPVRALECFVEESHWYRSCYENYAASDVPGNRFTTVAKDALKHRGICVEPSLNLWFQLDVGGHLKKRLLTHAGLDLKNGKALHQKLAQLASLRGHLATIDLSNASDTVCVNLVRLLLPQEWVDFLEMLRSPKTFIDGKWVVLHKHSSMGNGYTFELETLIFWALASTVATLNGLTTDVVKVYGDDIIVPTDIAQEVVSCLQFSGFSLNMKKSFLSGPFRESCGGDFFEGKSVRTHFLEKEPNEPQHWISLANGIRRLGGQNNGIPDYLGTYHRTWFRCLDAIPSQLRRLRGPEELGDLVIHDCESRWSTRSCSRGIRWIIGYAPVAKPIPVQQGRVSLLNKEKHRPGYWEAKFPAVVLSAALLGIPETGVVPRGSVSGYRIKGIAYS